MDTQLALELLERYVFLTNYTSTLISEEKQRFYLGNVIFGRQPNPPPGGIPYPALAFYARFQARERNEYFLTDFWSYQTLLNLVIGDWSIMQRVVEEIIEERFPYQEGTLQSLARSRIETQTFGQERILRKIFGHFPSNEELLISYFGHLPTREELLREIVKSSIGVVKGYISGDEKPTTSLLSGIFFAPGYEKMIYYEGGYVSWNETFANLQYISDEDWVKLAQLYGLSSDASREEITRTIIQEQNGYIEKLVTFGLEMYVNRLSLIRVAYQRLMDNFLNFIVPVTPTARYSSRMPRIRIIPTS